MRASVQVIHTSVNYLKRFKIPCVYKNARLERSQLSVGGCMQCLTRAALFVIRLFTGLWPILSIQFTTKGKHNRYFTGT